jgi:hypothetical protein
MFLPMVKNTSLEDPVPIGTRREFFWDDFLIDAARTTATRRLHRPEPREVVIVHDQPWEGNGCNFHCILEDDGLYRLYYLGWEMLDPEATVHTTNAIVLAYAESTDGLHWTKPSLGLCDHQGSTANNILVTGMLDAFSVFKDSNPDCPPEERYKGVGMAGDRHLWCFTSPDGLRFRKAWPMSGLGTFDTLNIALWDRHTRRYLCYLRDYHEPTGEDCPPGRINWSTGIRDIRWMESVDFKTWSVPRRLDFGGAPDYPLYSNVVQPYYRGDHMLVGFPSRYVERKTWTPNYDRLPGADLRRKLVKINPRYGLTVTDCVFMSSRDGQVWNRTDEAFMTPGPERQRNWVYGDCFPAVGLIETPGHPDGAPAELSLYVYENHWARHPAELRRYTLRVDGFVSRNATYEPQRVVTRPFVYSGRALTVNFATSAAGYLRIRLCSNGKTLTSHDLFGDSLDARVAFKDGEVASLAGTPVTMDIEMSDADIYSFAFEA